MVVGEASFEEAVEVMNDGFVAGHEIETVVHEDEGDGGDGASKNEAREAGTHCRIPRCHCVLIDEEKYSFFLFLLC